MAHIVSDAKYNALIAELEAYRATGLTPAEITNRLLTSDDDYAPRVANLRQDQDEQVEDEAWNK